MADLTLVVVGKDNAAVLAFDQHHWGGAAVRLVPNIDGDPLSEIANWHLELSTRPVFGLCHADAVFGPGALEAFTAEAMRGAVCGIVGVDLAGVYHCSYNSDRDRWWKGDQRIGEPGQVSTLDCMAVFFRKDLGISFDEEEFDSFHCHVEDLCLQAHARGIPVTVPAADAHHRNHTQAPEFLADYRKYRARLAEKWKGTEFRTT
jgi:hypothetical protein